MNKIQKLRLELAEKRIECTPSEVKDLMKICKEIRKFSKVSNCRYLRSLLDLNDPKHQIIYDLVMRFKKK